MGKDSQDRDCPGPEDLHKAKKDTPCDRCKIVAPENKLHPNSLFSIDGIDGKDSKLLRFHGRVDVMPTALEQIAIK